MINATDIIRLHDTCVEKWHLSPIDNPYSGINATICTQHAFNYQLWHQEDIARSNNVSDAEIARVKRTIDRLNQQRNNWIEKVDDEISQLIEDHAVEPPEDAPLRTETPGSAVDRLSIMSLRIYHMGEQLEREDVDEDHIHSVRFKLRVCHTQRDELTKSLQQLLDDILCGKCRHRTYRQMKMYNDPSLNPYLYGEAQTLKPRRAG